MTKIERSGLFKPASDYYKDIYVMSKIREEIKLNYSMGVQRLRDLLEEFEDRWHEEVKWEPAMQKQIVERTEEMLLKTKEEIYHEKRN